MGSVCVLTDRGSSGNETSTARRSAHSSGMEVLPYPSCWKGSLQIPCSTNFLRKSHISIMCWKCSGIDSQTQTTALSLRKATCVHTGFISRVTKGMPMEFLPLLGSNKNPLGIYKRSFWINWNSDFLFICSLDLSSGIGIITLIMPFFPW